MGNRSQAMPVRMADINPHADQLQRAIFKDVGEHLRNNVAVVVAFALSLYTLLRLLFVSRFDPSVATTIVAENGLPNLLIGTFVADSSPIFAALALGALTFVIVRLKVTGIQWLVVVGIWVNCVLLGPIYLAQALLISAPITIFLHAAIVRNARRRLLRATQSAHSLQLAFTSSLEAIRIANDRLALEERELRRLRSEWAVLRSHAADLSPQHLTAACVAAALEQSRSERRVSEARKAVQNAKFRRAEVRLSQTQTHRDDSEEADRRAIGRAVVYWPLLIIALNLLMLSLNARPWWPLERINVSQGQVTGYVLSLEPDSNGWATILDVHNVVLRVPSDQISGRQNCPLDDPPIALRLATQIGQRPEGLGAPCPDPNP
jgi:hypothetical protein